MVKSYSVDIDRMHDDELLKLYANLYTFINEYYQILGSKLDLEVELLCLDKASGWLRQYSAGVQRELGGPLKDIRQRLYDVSASCEALHGKKEDGDSLLSSYLASQVRNINSELHRLELTEDTCLHFDSKKYYFFLIVKIGKDCFEKLKFNASALSIIHETLGNYFNEKARYKHFLVLSVDIYALHISVGKRIFISSLGVADTDWYVIISKISASRYEKKECSAKIAIVGHNCPNLEEIKSSMSLVFKTKVPIEDYKLIRKLLELTDSSKYLCSLDGRTVSGLIHKKYLDSAHTSLMDIKGHLWWEFIGAGDAANVYYKEGAITIQNLSPDRKETAKIIRDALNIVEVNEDLQGKMNRMVNVISYAAELNHGGMLVFMDEGIEREVKRLNGILIDPLPIEDSETLSSLTSIDGAIFVDFHGRCHAISVILDGIAKSGAERSRGARYNSAERYYHEKIKSEELKCKFFVVVISDDGMVDFFYQ